MSGSGPFRRSIVDRMDRYGLTGAAVAFSTKCDTPIRSSRRVWKRVGRAELLSRLQPVRVEGRTTFFASKPLAPSTISNSTSDPSLSDLKPSPRIALWWTKMSLPPPSGLMNP
jgi:hypothetical protein